MNLSQKIKTTFTPKTSKNINKFLEHIYVQLSSHSTNKHSSEHLCNIQTPSTLSINTTNCHNEQTTIVNDYDSLYTAQNSETNPDVTNSSYTDIYNTPLYIENNEINVSNQNITTIYDSFNFKEKGFYEKKSHSASDFDWECSCYLKLIDSQLTPPIMFANKEILTIVYDTRRLQPIRKALETFLYTSQSTFSLFLHDLFSFISSLNYFVIHNSISLDNIFFDSINSKFYITDLEHCILKTETEDYLSDTSDSFKSGSHSLSLEYSDFIRIYNILTTFVSSSDLDFNTDLNYLKMINRIFTCYIPIDYIKSSTFREFKF